ncbi:MAG: DUF1016 family protein [Bacteroidetes bacterium]|nr:MAG: DUF1016 family protein [Bacteroidota bacterium]
MKFIASSYSDLVNSISETYSFGRVNAFKQVNKLLVDTYWRIGKNIVEFEQGGNVKSQYGSQLLERLSKDLSLQFGKGFSLSNLQRFRQFYILYPNYAISSHNLQKSDNQFVKNHATASHDLSWSHYVELIKIENDLERSFYEQQIRIEKWSINELIRQKNTSLFLRLASGKNKDEILKLANQGIIIEKPEDILKDTYVFEFLKIPEPFHLTENDLETRLISQLQDFLLELGKGFAFIGRRYIEAEQNVEGDNPPIGLILAREKDELQIKYAMSHTDSRLFVQKYQLFLPNEDELRRKIQSVYEEQ